MGAETRKENVTPSGTPEVRQPIKSASAEQEQNGRGRCRSRRQGQQGEGEPVREGGKPPVHQPPDSKGKEPAAEIFRGRPGIDPRRRNRRFSGSRSFAADCPP